MSMYHQFCDTYFSDAVEQELEIYYEITDYEPESGIDWEFEWEALDEEGKDRRADMTNEEQEACERLIYEDIQSEYRESKYHF